MPEGKVEFILKSSLDRNWEFFRDTERWASCIPGCKGITRVSETEWDGQFDVRVLHTTRTAQGRLQLVQIDPPASIGYEGKGELREAFHRYALTLRAQMHLEAVSENETRVAFAGEVAARGLGGALINKIVSAKMDEMVRGFEQNVREKLEKEG